MAMNPIDVEFLTDMVEANACAQGEIREYWEASQMSGALLDPEVAAIATDYAKMIEEFESRINIKLQNGSVDQAQNALDYAMQNVQVMSNTPSEDPLMGF